MTFDPTSVEVLCVTLPNDPLCPSPMKIHQSMWIQWPFLQKKTWTKGHWPLDDLWPHICWGHMCDSTQGSLCPSPMKIHLCGYSDLFCKNLKWRSLTPRWPLTPHLLRSHVWLYPRIIVFKSHENTLKYVDTVTLFAKTWTKGQWPLDDLWPHICWGLMCDSTQWSIVSKSHENTSKYVDTVTFFAKKKLEPKVIDP